MLKDLIESSSHNREFKRRGSFFLFTFASYILFLTVAGMVSILAYEARLEDRVTETVLTMLPPAEVSPSEPIKAGPRSVGHGGGGNTATGGAKEQIATVDHPKAPDEISTDRNPFLPGSRKDFFNNDSGTGLGPGGSANDGPGGGGSEVSSNVPRVIEIDEAPPVIKREKPQTQKRGIINSEAISLPKPPYPPLALRTGTQGKVTIQVLIDEGGKVISAKAVSGSPLLIHAAVTAAYQARFSPTFIGDQTVKVSGLITYNFVID